MNGLNESKRPPKKGTDYSVPRRKTSKPRRAVGVDRAVCPLFQQPPEIDHLGIAVRSIDRALQFYRDQLGLAVSLRETVAPEKVNVAMLPLGDPRIELIEPADNDSAVAKFLDKRGEGLHHLAIRIPDFDAVLDRLRKSGAKLLNEPRKGAGGHTYVFVHPSSAGGVLLELIKE